MRKFFTFALLSLLAVPFVACSSSDETPPATSTGGKGGAKTDAGTGGQKAQGGTGQGGTGTGGTGDGGTAQGGSGQGGSGQGGTGDGGTGTGGTGDGGTGTGGTGTGGTGTGGTGTGGTGTGGTGTGGSGGSNCDPATAPDSTQCKTCMQGAPSGACKAQYDACGASSDCVGVNDCLGACTTDACIEGCFTANPAGATIFFSYYGCIQASCHDPCSCPGCSLTVGDPTCDGCFTVKCLQECNGCDMSPACMGSIYCRSYLCTQGDTACYQDCYDANPGAEAAEGALGSCMGNQCATECSK